jgi:hypothetical protein
MLWINANARVVTAIILMAGCAGIGDWARVMSRISTGSGSIRPETPVSPAAGPDMPKTVSSGRSKMKIPAESGPRILRQRLGRNINAK